MTEYWKLAMWTAQHRQVERGRPRVRWFRAKAMWGFYCPSQGIDNMYERWDVALHAAVQCSKYHYQNGS